jgi:hypothetical protein
MVKFAQSALDRCLVQRPVEIAVGPIDTGFQRVIERTKEQVSEEIAIIAPG